MNDFLYLNSSKIIYTKRTLIKKNYKETVFRKEILSVLWPFIKSKFHYKKKTVYML